MTGGSGLRSIGRHSFGTIISTRNSILNLTHWCYLRKGHFGLDAEALALSDKSSPARQGITIMIERRARAPHSTFPVHDSQRALLDWDLGRSSRLC